MSRFLLLVSGCLLAITSAVLFGASSASAASVYDNAYKTTDELTLQGVVDGFPHNVTDTYNEIIDGAIPQSILDENYSQIWYHDGNTRKTVQSEIDAIKNGWLQNKDRWTVSENCNYRAWSDEALVSCKVILYYTITGNTGNGLTVNFEPPTNTYPEGRTTVGGNTLHRLEISLNRAGNRIDIHKWTGTGAVTVNTISGSQYDSAAKHVFTNRNLIAYANNVAYPAGYAGETVRETYSTAPIGPVKFNYHVTDKHIRLENATQDLRGDEECRWYINENPAELYEEGDTANDRIISRDCTAQPEHTFAEYGWYEATLAITYPRGIDGSSEKTTWDAYHHIKVDGTTYSGVADVHGGHPADDPLKNGILGSLDALNVNVHGLQAFFLAPIDFFQTLPARVGNCSPISIPLLNTSIQLPCLSGMYWSWSSTIMVIYQTMVNGLVAYFVATRIFQKVKDINDPKKDSIEVVKL